MEVSPNTARMIDYWLGGSHYFPIDVEAAKVCAGVYPDFPTVFRELRDYIGQVSRYIELQGIDQQGKRI
ncbi:SAM-dependent methyltransferase [Coleofasciculus sp. FACHB-64]|uniref:SAM-dependent methyltransferase n=1 Tax=Cyanophyceae TaxID=3028117 RepID=UPI001688B549|nr:SAM-dependent methyltransferase [Coleofasciculus sp. FACHB-64]MBD2046075.1 SAM-dependent methyltransferase [Coleofasciculus sp. FACHB-64]